MYLCFWGSIKDRWRWVKQEVKKQVRSPYNNDYTKKDQGLRQSDRHKVKI